MIKKYMPWMWAILSVAGIAVAGVAYVDEQQEKLEEYNRYQIALTSYSEEEINRFTSDFPDSKYQDMLDLRRTQIRNIHKEWDFLRKFGNVQDYRDFAKRYPQSPLSYECDRMIDSLDWNEAQELRSLDAFVAYLKQHPNGRYVKEATEEKKKIERTVLTEGELAEVNRIMNRLKEAIDHGLSSHYDSLKQNGVVLSDSALMKYLFDNYRSITNITQTTIRKKYINEVTLYETSVGFTYAEHQADSIQPVDISLTTILNSDFRIKNIVLRR
jgi:hypothetical protein